MAGSSPFERGVSKAIAAPFRKALILSVILLVAVVGRIGIDIYLASKNGDEMVSRLQQALRDDLAYTSRVPRVLPELLDGPEARALKWALATYELVYVFTSTDRLVNKTTDKPSEMEISAQRGVSEQRSVFAAMMVGTQIVAVRASILMGIAPLFLLLYFVAGLDGLAARSVRKSAGGRESSSMYHRTKHMQVVCMTMAVLGYVWYPGSVDPATIFTGTAVFCACLMRVQAKYLKKYL